MRQAHLVSFGEGIDQRRDAFDNARLSQRTSAFRPRQKLRRFNAFESSPDGTDRTENVYYPSNARRLKRSSFF